MSGWDTSSRPTWDSEDGQGDSTQAFSSPEFPESDGDRWPESGAPRSRADQQPGYRSSRNGSGPSGYANGTHEPGAAEPPDIFERDYGRDRQGQAGYRSPGAAEQDHARLGYEAADFPPQVPQVPQVAQPSQSSQAPQPPQDFTAGRNGIPTGYVPRDREREARDRSSAGREYVARDYGGRAADSDRAHMDPALQDFFAPQADRRDPAQPGPAQPGPVGRHSARGPADGRRDDEASDGFGDEQPAGAEHGQPRQPRPPWPGQPRQAEMPPAREDLPGRDLPGRDLPGRDLPGRDLPGRGGDWSSQADRARVAGPLTGPFFRAPGSKALTRGRRPGPRERMLVAVGIVLLVVIGVGLYLVGKGSNNDTGGAGNQALPLPSTTGASHSTGPTPTARASTGTNKPAAKTAAKFVLATPATAGGYPLMASVPSYVQGPASTTAQAIRSAALSDGGKVTGKVSAAYQLRFGQVMAFTGYEGTFSPSKVVASLATIGTGESTYSAGKDGGKLACAVAPGSQPGTVCVWVTSTTLGITEFFSPTGPEAVTDQAKTASDTRNFRAGVETRKS